MMSSVSGHVCCAEVSTSTIFMAPALTKQAAAPSPNRALATIFAFVIAGGQVRVGDATNMQELADLGVTVIDLTNLEADDAANHSKFAQLVAVGPELGTVLGKGLGQSTAQGQQSAAGTLGTPIRIISGQYPPGEGRRSCLLACPHQTWRNLATISLGSPSSSACLDPS